MRVHLIKRQTVLEFAVNNVRSRLPLQNWLIKLQYADWKTAADISKTFSRADVLGHGSNRVVFDIGGNNFRLIGKYQFGAKEVHLFVCWIGTHVNYDRLCKSGRQYTISDY